MLSINDFLPPKRRTSTYLGKHHPEILKEISKYDKFGVDSIGEKLYLYLNNLEEPPVCKCPDCNNYRKFISMTCGYRPYCSADCQRKDPACRIKAKDTCLQRYGVTSYSKTKECREKTEKTNLERYGVKCNFLIPEVKEQIKKTNLERYGVENPSQSPIVREKVKNTCLQRYGVACSLASEEIKQKAKKTNLERYGVEFTSQNPEIREKTKKTNLERYGNETAMASGVIKEKCKRTCMERYGVDNPMKSKSFQLKAQETNLKKYGVRFTVHNPSSLSKMLEKRNELFAEKYNLIKLENSTWWVKCPHPECDKCKDKYYVITSSQYFSRRTENIEPCTNLLPVNPSNSTYIELFARNILDEHGIQYESNDRKILDGKELDIYIPTLKLAIECNGIYWHSMNANDKRKPKDHIIKYDSCRDKGIQLLTIWEDQIINHPDIVKSIILSKIGLFDKKIGARECVVHEINSDMCNEFLNLNHIQGRTNSKVRLGLFYKNELVSVMTFSKRSKLSGSKKYSNGEWDLSRFCTRLNTQIIGGADKLLKYFIKKYQPQTIISFASNDISNGSLYEKLGFTKECETLCYWYIHKDSHIRLHRSNFTKDRLKKLGYDVEGKTEDEIMRNTEYLKIYDSGHTRYRLQINNNN